MQVLTGAKFADNVFDYLIKVLTSNIGRTSLMLFCNVPPQAAHIGIVT